jgi:oligoendopeptidase F
MDVEERPTKSSRAFTATVRIPEDVRLVVMPKGGQTDYTSMLHEAGHTVHHASVKRTLPMEYKWLGDSSVTETYAFLFEYLTLNKKWLSEYAAGNGLSKYLDFAYLYKLSFLRRYGAKLKYELLLHVANRVRDMAEEYKKTLEASLKYKHPRAHYLSDVDDGFYAAQYLRAWILEAQLRAKITEKYGETWFKCLEAGKFLRELWSTGQKYDAVELAQRIGYKELDVKPMLSEFEEHFA